MGTLLWAVDRFSSTGKQLDGMTAGRAVIIGCAQAFALVPGFSRSGTTITAARALGFDRKAAATFSFLLSLPITVAAVGAKAPDALHDGITSQLIIGVTAAAVSSWAAIAFLLRYVARRSYGVFAAYRWIAGLIVLGLWWTRA
jgi:undecaprenyl-diphosphatase